MSDHSELKRLALACGNLNWRFLTEKLTEYGIRDDHGYIAFLHVGHPTKYGACPEREAKARFLGAMTPAVVLGLLAEIERMREDACFRAVKSLRGDCKDLMVERDQLKTENEALRKDAERYQWLRDKSESVHQFYLSTPIWFTGVRFRKEDVNSSIDTAMGKGERS